MSQIESFVTGPLKNNCYLIYSEESRTAVVVDPALLSFTPVHDFLEENDLSLQAIWLTHSHWDHVADAHLFVESYHVPVYVHEHDEENVHNPGSDGLFPYIEVSPIQKTVALHGNEILQVGNDKWKVLHTPGHSLGCISFWNEKENVLLTGDTLFKGTIGNTSFPTSSSHLMEESLKLLLSLPDETTILPGHGEKTTLRKERSWLKNFKIH